MEQLTYKEIQALKGSLTEEEYLEVLYYNYPSIWIEEYIIDPQALDGRVKLRDYQLQMINSIETKKVIRCGRQIGKSFQIAALSIYYSIKRPGSKILLIGPQQTHITNLFDTINELIDGNDYLKSMIKSKTKQPREIKWVTKSIIKGFTTGESSGGDALAIRGQTANILFVDEADYISDSVMEKVVIPTTNSFKKPLIYLSSTPSGRRGYYRRMWDSGYYQTFHFPSSVSPAWSPEKEAEARAGCTKLSYLHEYEADWGDTESGLFGKDDMREAANRSILPFPNSKVPDGILPRHYSYSDPREILDELIKPKFRILGVDWNKKENGTRLVWVDVDDFHQIYVRGQWKIDDQEFTQNIAMQKIIELHQDINFNYICVDVGYGSTQIEDLRLYGMKHPETKIKDIVIAVPTDGSIEIKDIATGEKRKTYVKNFIVESTIRFMEQYRIRIPIEEKLTERDVSKKTSADTLTLFDQLNEFVIDKYTANGRPIYTCNADDHSVDAFMFTIYGYLTQVIKTQDLWSKHPKARAKTISYDKILTLRQKKELLKSGIDKETVKSKTAETAYNQTYVAQGNMTRTINYSGSRGYNRRFSKRTGRNIISRKIR